MVNLTDCKLRNRFEPLIGEIVDIKPIGNHELNRHLVYKVSCKKKNYVVKLYYKKNKWNREVASLKLLSNTEVLVPTIIDYGVFDDGLEWLITEFIDGEILEDVKDDISSDNMYELYRDLGKQLGIIHTFREFDFYGSMSENAESIEGIKSYRLYFEQRLDRIIKELYTYQHDQLELIEESEKQLKSTLEILDDVTTAHLCHNDFKPRNVIVKKQGQNYETQAIIDFEDSVPSDVDKELSYVYLPLLEEKPKLAEAFRSGYEQYNKILIARLTRKKDMYYLFEGLLICAWAKEVAYDYYLSGVKQLEHTMVKYLGK